MEKNDEIKRNVPEQQHCSVQNNSQTNDQNRQNMGAEPQQPYTQNRPYHGQQYQQQIYRGVQQNYQHFNRTEFNQNKNAGTQEYIENKNKGTTSMVLGIVSLGIVLIPFIGWVGGIVTGIIGMVQGLKAKKVLRPEDRGKATAGFVCSVVALSIVVLIWVLFFIGLLAGSMLNNSLSHYYNF